MAFDRNKPYNSLPLLPPDRKKWETMEVYKKLAEARAALAELKGRAPVIPNPMMLLNTLVIQEAKDSSTIENIFTSSDNLYKALTAASYFPDGPTKEVLRYREAIWVAYNKLNAKNELNRDVLVSIFKTLTEKNEGIRNKQVWISTQVHVVYTPPEHGAFLDEKLNNWFDFANAPNGIDPLIKMAFLHHQFESIHPFTDGNGRTGRMINVLYLNQKDLLDLPILYLSKFILENKKDYYRLLTEVRENGNWEAWLLYMLEGVAQTSRYTLEKVNAIYDLFRKVQNQIKEEAKDIYSYELVETIFSQLYCKIAILVEKQIASRNTASKYLKKLTEMGILQQKEVGKEQLYLNRQLYDLLSKG